MTTLWARMLVIEAWKKGEITEECAHYFDELLFKRSTKWLGYYNSEKILVEIQSFNTKYDEVSVIQKIGCPENSTKFDVLEYIKNSSFEKGYTIGDETVYLSNIINEEFSLLVSMISNEFGISEWSDIREDQEWNKESNYESLMIIKNYLEKTNYRAYHNYHDCHFKKNFEECIKHINNKKISKTQEEKTKTYDKPAYTDLIDADY